MKKLLGIALTLMVLFSLSACTVSRGVSPASPGSGENWATQRAVRR